MNDPGEQPLAGSLLWARHGKASFVYTGLAFFRQLPAGVAGRLSPVRESARGRRASWEMSRRRAGAGSAEKRAAPVLDELRTRRRF